MDIAPRTSFCFLSLSGLLYLMPPASWLTRSSFEGGLDQVHDTLGTLEVMGRFLSHLLLS